jgi:methionyl aminopeptidase
MNVCSKPNCHETAKLRCPKCIEKKLMDAWYCSQDCFKVDYNNHKIKHNINDPFPTYRYTGKLRAVYPLSPKRVVPASIPRPDWADHPQGIPVSERAVRGKPVIEVLKPDEIEKMRTVCRLAREVLEAGAKAVKVGTTTDEIDRIVHDACVERQCYPSPLNYYNFPKSCCTSINEVICHGIPDQYELQDGDICNLDVSTMHDGFHGDLNATYLVGNVDAAGRKLVETTRKCLDEAIRQSKPGVAYRDLGATISRIAEAEGFSVVRTYCGHGINRHFHCSPSVPHYAKNKAVGIMAPGHTFTIEPMINESKNFNDEQWPDVRTSPVCC